MKQHLDTESKVVRDLLVNQNMDCQEHSSETTMLKRRAAHHPPLRHLCQGSWFSLPDDEAERDQWNWQEWFIGSW